MQSIFLRVLDMSITASLVILAVIIARLLLKKAPKKFSYALWALVLLRLLCPWSIESVLSLIPEKTQSIPQEMALEESVSENIDAFAAFDAAQRAVGDTLNGGIDFIDIKLSSPVPVPDSETAIETETVSASHSQVWLLAAGYVWPLGMAAMLLWSAVSYLRLRRRLRTAVHAGDDIWLADGIDSPFVMGIFRPKIYLPSTIGEAEKGYIIAHERCHIRRRDHIIKLLAFAALTLHWFNPLVWLAFALYSRDMEMSCDEAVIGQLGEGIRADYSASLLSLATGRRAFAGTPLAFGEGDPKGRIKNLAAWKKPAVWLSAVAAVVVIVAAVCLLTDPAGKLPAQIRLHGLVYTQQDYMLAEPPEGCLVQGEIESIIHGTWEEPKKDFVATNLDAAWRGNSIYQKDVGTLYLPIDGGCMVFTLEDEKSAFAEPLDERVAAEIDGEILLHEGSFVVSRKDDTVSFRCIKLKKFLGITTGTKLYHHTDYDLDTGECVTQHSAMTLGGIPTNLYLFNAERNFFLYSVYGGVSDGSPSYHIYMGISDEEPTIELLGSNCYDLQKCQVEELWVFVFRAASRYTDADSYDEARYAEAVEGEILLQQGRLIVSRSGDMLSFMQMADEKLLGVSTGVVVEKQRDYDLAERERLQEFEPLHTFNDYLKNARRNFLLCSGDDGHHVEHPAEAGYGVWMGVSDEEPTLEALGEGFFDLQFAEVEGLWVFIVKEASEYLLPVGLVVDEPGYTVDSEEEEYCREAYASLGIREGLYFIREYYVDGVLRTDMPRSEGWIIGDDWLLLSESVTAEGEYSQLIMERGGVQYTHSVTPNADQWMQASDGTYESHLSWLRNGYSYDLAFTGLEETGEGSRYSFEILSEGQPSGTTAVFSFDADGVLRSLSYDQRGTITEADGSEYEADISQIISFPDCSVVDCYKKIAEAYATVPEDVDQTVIDSEAGVCRNALYRMRNRDALHYSLETGTLSPEGEIYRGSKTEVWVFGADWLSREQAAGNTSTITRLVEDMRAYSRMELHDADYDSGWSTSGSYNMTDLDEWLYGDKSYGMELLETRTEGGNTIMEFAIDGNPLGIGEHIVLSSGWSYIGTTETYYFDRTSSGLYAVELRAQTQSVDGEQRELFAAYTFWDVAANECLARIYETLGEARMALGEWQPTGAEGSVTQVNEERSWIGIILDDDVNGEVLYEVYDPERFTVGDRVRVYAEGTLQLSGLFIPQGGLIIEMIE